MDGVKVLMMPRRAGDIDDATAREQNPAGAGLRFNLNTAAELGVTFLGLAPSDKIDLHAGMLSFIIVNSAILRYVNF